MRKALLLALLAGVLVAVPAAQATRVLDWNRDAVLADSTLVMPGGDQYRLSVAGVRSYALQLDETGAAGIGWGTDAFDAPDWVAFSVTWSSADGATSWVLASETLMHPPEGSVALDRQLGHGQLVFSGTADYFPVNGIPSTVPFSIDVAVTGNPTPSVYARYYNCYEPELWCIFQSKQVSGVMTGTVSVGELAFTSGTGQLQRFREIALDAPGMPADPGGS